MDVETEIAKIKERNCKVEQDKNWEISWFRKIIIAVLTYLVMVSFMWSIKVEKPYINAIIPTLGFILSTLSLSFLRQIWEKFRS